jgi:hypothetical protein
MPPSPQCWMMPAGGAWLRCARGADDPGAGGRISRAGLPDRERRRLSTQDVLSRFVAALGGTLKLIADFLKPTLATSSSSSPEQAKAHLQAARCDPRRQLHRHCPASKFTMQKWSFP